MIQMEAGEKRVEHSDINWGHAWASNAHEIPAPVSTNSHPIQSFMNWWDHACVNGVSPGCVIFNKTTINYKTFQLLIDTNESRDPTQFQSEKSSHKCDTNEKKSNNPVHVDIQQNVFISEQHFCDKSSFKRQTYEYNITRISQLQISNCDITSLKNQPSQHSISTHLSRRNHKTSFWTFFFLCLFSLTSLSSASRDVPVKKCCPEGRVLDESYSCIRGNASSPFNTILRGLDPSRINYRDHPVDISLVSTGVSLPGRRGAMRSYKLEQGTAWLTVGGRLITKEFEADFSQFSKGEICVDRTRWGDRVAVMEDPCEGTMCLTLCCPHGQALVDDPNIEAAVDENVPKICGNFDWDWRVKFWNESYNREVAATRNEEFVLREDVDHDGSFSCPSNCGGKKGTLGFADSTYSQVRLYSDGTLRGKLGDISHHIENKRFCVAYGDPPNYDYGEADTGMRVTFMVCSQPKCPSTAEGVASENKSGPNPISANGFIILIFSVSAVIVGCAFCLRSAFLQYRQKEEVSVGTNNSIIASNNMNLTDYHCREQVNISPAIFA